MRGPTPGPGSWRWPTTGLPNSTWTGIRPCCGSSNRRVWPWRPSGPPRSSNGSSPRRGGPEAQPDEHTVLAPPTTTTIRRGDVFHLGRHRLACGDATSATDVARLLDGATPRLMVTDPPYGVNYQPAFRHQAYPRQRTAVGRVTNDTRADWAAAYALFPGDVAYVWHAALFADVVMAGLRQAEFEVRSQIIWAKPTFVLGRGAYHWQHEPAWFAVRQGCVAPWYGGRAQSTVWEVPNLNPFGGSRTERQHAHRPCDAEAGAGVRDPDPQSHHGAGRRL